MSRFSDVVGHEQIIKYFQNAVSQDKLAHSYIITGEKGSGKKLLAGLFAKTVQCEAQGMLPCEECVSCRQSDSGNQPDIIWVTHEKPASIGVDDIRGQLIGDMQIKPYKSPHKIYIIDEAEKLTVQAQNALLKTIEEPPEYGMIIFLTANSDIFLPTIISRCVMLNLHPLADRLVKKYLMEKIKVPDYKADICVAFSQGNLGRAVKLAQSEVFDSVKTQLIYSMKNADRLELSRLMAGLKEAESTSFDINDYLDLILIWYRDVLLYKATKDTQRLVFRDEAEAIRTKAGKCTYEGIEAVINAIGNAKLRLRANVNEEVVMELMFLMIKEN